MDDAQKPGEALSEAMRRAANAWFDETLFSRLNSKSEGCIIIVMQRLDPYVLRKGVSGYVGHPTWSTRW